MQNRLTERARLQERLQDTELFSTVWWRESSLLLNLSPLDFLLLTHAQPHNLLWARGPWFEKCLLTALPQP